MAEIVECQTRACRDKAASRADVNSSSG